MRTVTFLFYILIPGSCFCLPKATKQLFQIHDKGKIGFMDSTGKIIIKPVYRFAGDYSEGLAYACINWEWGYINNTGNFIIAPQFDYALSFAEGLALVTKEGKPFFIDKTGKKAFEFNFMATGSFQNGRALIKTFTNKMGFIDHHGKLIIDTVFEQIRPFKDGLAVVLGVNHHQWDVKSEGIKRHTEVGIIDSTGKFIVPYGVYGEIGNLNNGYFKVVIEADEWRTEAGFSRKFGFIDKKGNLIFTVESNEAKLIDSRWLNASFNCGLAKIQLYKPWRKKKSEFDNNTEYEYEGYVNSKGFIVINDTNFKYVEDFSNNRAFVMDINRNYHLINTSGEIISKDTFSDIFYHQFYNWSVFVKKHGKWGLIDTNGNYLISPRFDGIENNWRINDYFFFSQQGTSENIEDNLVGVAGIDGKIRIKPIFNVYDPFGFQNGILACYIGNSFCYLDKQGKIIWKEIIPAVKELTNLNIDFMNKGYFYVYSKQNKNDLSGFANSENIPRKITKEQNFPKNVISIVVKSDVRDTIFKKNYALKVYVANASNINIDFNSKDSRLYMKVQALNPQGEWKDIEYLEGNSSTNSYHILTLEPENYWSFRTPVYEGSFKTKLRIELKYIDPKDISEKSWDKKEITIYSNEYSGSINPGQFWRKQPYHPEGILYNYEY